jgi:hypothetical protein
MPLFTWVVADSFPQRSEPRNLRVMSLEDMRIRIEIDVLGANSIVAPPPVRLLSGMEYAGLVARCRHLFVQAVTNQEIASAISGDAVRSGVTISAAFVASASSKPDQSVHVPPQMLSFRRCPEQYLMVLQTPAWPALL